MKILSHLVTAVITVCMCGVVLALIERTAHATPPAVGPASDSVLVISKEAPPSEVLVLHGNGASVQMPEPTDESAIVVFSTDGKPVMSIDHDGKLWLSKQKGAADIAAKQLYAAIGQQFMRCVQR